MVSTGSDFQFASVIEGLLSLKKWEGPNANLLRIMARDRAMQLLAHPDVRYMPAFKILDLLAAFANTAADITAATQLRAQEAKIVLREALADGTPLIRQFMLDAALERARYAPMMLLEQPISAAEARAQLLQQRWAAMRAAHQEQSPLPEDWLETVDEAVDAAITASEFQNFRHGPLLQFFSEMLEAARKLERQQAPLASLGHALRMGGPLWKRYALKADRYTAKPGPNPHHTSFHALTHTTPATLH